MKKYYLILIINIITLNIYAQNVKRVAYSGFFEIGAAYSPKGDYYIYYGSNKPKNNTFNSLPEDHYYLNIIRLNDLDTNNFKYYKEYTSINIITYPYAFIDWKSNHELLFLNIKEQSIWIYDIKTKSKKLWFITSKKILDSISYTDIVMKKVRFKYDEEKADIAMFYNKENVVFINSLKSKRINKVEMSKSIIDFDINFKNNQFVGFLYDKETTYSDLIIHDLITNKTKTIQSNIQDYPSRASIQYSSNEDIFTYRIRGEENGEIMDFIYSYDNEKNKLTQIFSLSGLFYDMIHFEYNSKSKYKIACTLWSMNNETPEQKIKHSNIVYNAVTLFYVGMALPKTERKITK